MPVTNNDAWFKRLAQAVRDIVEEHSGAIVMTRPELLVATVEEDSGLKGCPAVVFDHITCSLRRVNLAVCSYIGTDPDVLLIFDEIKTERRARGIVEQNGLSADVRLHLLHSGLVGV